MAVTRKLHRTGVSLRDRKALLDYKPADPKVIEEARQLKEAALLQIGMVYSTMASHVAAGCYHHIPTTAIPTAAVILCADANPMFAYNPEFFVDLGRDGVEFVIYHEALHLVMRHLFNDPHLSADPVFTTATEACNNNMVMARLKRKTLPTASVEVVDDKGVVSKVRQQTGVDPVAVYQEYKADLDLQKLTPVPYEEFVRTDFVCYHELKRMTNPPESGAQGSGKGGVCIHQDDESEAGDKGVPQDADAVAELGKAILHATMKAALQGKENAISELLSLEDRTEGAPESTSKIWGDLGVGRLRGHTQANRRVDWWKQWFNDTFASKIKPGDRIVYVKKRGAIDVFLGLDPLLLARGDDEVKVALIAVDTSGSMPQRVLDYLTQLVGHTDGVESSWVAFDGVVAVFVPGESVPGGGGTNFANVMDYAEGRLTIEGRRMDVHPDVVVMLTDGYASPIRPQQPDKWMWLITEGGSGDWIAGQPDPMDWHQLATGDGVD